MLDVKVPERLNLYVNHTAQPMQLIGVCDAALMAVAHDTLLRNSERVVLYMKYLDRAADGTVLVHLSEAD